MSKLDQAGPSALIAVKNYSRFAVLHCLCLVIFASNWKSRVLEIKLYSYSLREEFSISGAWSNFVAY